MKPKALMEREYRTLTIEGNPVDIGGRWVLRNKAGDYLGHDRFRHDLRERFDDQYQVEIIGD